MIKADADFGGSAEDAVWWGAFGVGRVLVEEVALGWICKKRGVAREGGVV